MSDSRIDRIKENVHNYESISSANDDVEELLGVVVELETELIKQISLTQRICPHPAAWSHVCCQCGKVLSHPKEQQCNQ